MNVPTALVRFKDCTYRRLRIMRRIIVTGSRILPVSATTAPVVVHDNMSRNRPNGSTCQLLSDPAVESQAGVTYRRLDCRI